MHCPDTARDEEFFSGHVVPPAFRRGDVVRIAVLIGRRGDARRQQGGPHGVPDDGGLVEYADRVLRVIAPCGPCFGAEFRGVELLVDPPLRAVVAPRAPQRIAAVHAAVADPELGQPEVVAGCGLRPGLRAQAGAVTVELVEFYQGLLGARVRRDDILFRGGPHRSHHVVRHARGDFQQPVVPRGFVIVYPGFDEHAGVVDVVLHAQKPAVRAPAVVVLR